MSYNYLLLKLIQHKIICKTIRVFELSNILHAVSSSPLSEEHVSVLLDVRGDVSRDIRWAVLDLLEQSAPPLPAGYRPIFTDILVPPSTLAFCLPTAKCA